MAIPTGALCVRQENGRYRPADAWLELDMLSQTEALNQLRDGWDYDTVLRRCRDWLAEIEAEAEADAENAIMHDDSDHIW